MNITDVHDAIRKAVEKKGADYIYEQQPEEGCQYCVYEHDDDGGITPTAPSCIVGYTLHELGVTLDRLSEYEGHNVSGLYPLLDEYEIPHKVRSALQEAQATQDQGDSWGDSLAAFEAALSAAVNA